ncbi:hypothetical protein IF690_17595 [Pseudomonas sp. SK3(2021)]|uniref:hypothetical protein n=1 Tax=Pseudomonas sp. SK3(2021) TaxID=2841064 RepID=UPI00192C5D09|nr:hypothetical protein [Pseudomonas sp. SK3(2021)]QQZ39857.1 hypothetical protein IF690_17595 [Pseudomonas sp. SK3(2021)]
MKVTTFYLAVFEHVPQVSRTTQRGVDGRASCALAAAISLPAKGPVFIGRGLGDERAGGCARAIEN